MRVPFSRGCFKMPARKYRNFIGIFMIAMTTAILLQAIFGNNTLPTLGNKKQLRTMSLSKIQRHSTTPVSMEIDREVTSACYPNDLRPDDIDTPFKFYIYNLPSKYNYDIQRAMSTEKEHAYCYDLMYCGTGKELSQFRYIKGKSLFLPPFKGSSIYSNFTMSIRDTQQFSLEVVIHFKLLHSKYRTLDPKKADLFYIPAYTGLKCLQDREGASKFIEELFLYLKTNESKYFTSGVPHFSTLSKIQREQGSQLCTTLRQPDSENITYIDIEKEANPSWVQSRSRTIFGKSIIVAPYPSYIHFGGVKHDGTLLEYRGDQTRLKSSQFQLNVPPLSDRNVLLFLAAGSRRSNPFRAKIIDQFPFKTHGTYEEYIKQHSNIMKRPNSSSDSHQVMLITNECSTEHRTTTIPWMVNSVFCVQPPGDSPTRKSFYDSILSGCIPVLFKENFDVTYPFQDYLDYREFTVTVGAKLVSAEGRKIMDIVQQIPKETIQDLHKNLLRVAKWFQYSLSDGSFQEDDDAITLILQQLRDLYHL